MNRMMYVVAARECVARFFHAVGAMRLAVFAGISAFAATASAATTIAVDSVVQRWPWNNCVDITYTIAGEGQTEDNLYKVVFTTVIDGTTYTIEGPAVGARAEAGTHTVTWEAPDGVKSDACTMSAALYAATVADGGTPPGNDYMIINLDTGAVHYEGLLATQDASNRRYNTDAYKTDFIVLRKVPKWADRNSLPNAASLPSDGYPTGDNTVYDPAKCEMGSTYANANANTPKKWPTNRDYYLGVFPVTQNQYLKIQGENPSIKPDDLKMPVQNIGWIDLRGNITPATAIEAASDGTFIQRLKYLTGNTLEFDLPTEVMHEIATRAGTTSAYLWGDSYDARFHYISASGCDVGNLLPNAWGFYKMTGTMREWCRDTSGYSNLSAAPDAFTPHSDNGGWVRIRSTPTWRQGINFNKTMSFCASHRLYTQKKLPEEGSDVITFRLSVICPVAE